jgi:DNA-directed RNA polymerase subunit N (RpoN/RPB10)
MSLNESVYSLLLQRADIERVKSKGPGPVLETLGLSNFCCQKGDITYVNWKGNSKSSYCEKMDP